MFLKLSLTTMLLQVLLRNMQSSIWKLIGQYDYPKLGCHQSLNPEIYMCNFSNRFIKVVNIYCSINGIFGSRF